MKPSSKRAQAPLAKSASAPDRTENWGRRVLRFWLDPVDAVRVRLFECLFTLSFLIWMGRCFTTWEEWLTEEGFHLNAQELRSMGYPEPWPLLVPWQVVCLAGLICISAALVLWPVGRPNWRWSAPTWLRRIGLTGLFLCALYVQRVDYMSAFTLNKLFVGIYAILAVAPGIWREQETGRLLQSAAPLRVLQGTLILQYFAAGIAKANGDWLKGHDILWGQVQGVYRTELAAWSLRNLPAWAWAAQQHLSFVFEMFAPLFFLVRRLLPVAFILGIGFHAIIALMMKDLIYFSFQMWTFYILFLPESFLNRLLRRETQVSGPVLGPCASSV